MKKANIKIENNALFSLDFDDIYFDKKDALNERKFVYSEAFEFTQNESFVIGELGFGIGLNFFLTLKRFLNLKKRPKRLFYVSLEGFYIAENELREIYKKLGFYEEFGEILERFLHFYPRMKDGIYRFYFGDIFLDLVFGDAQKSLKELDFKADVWFLDGFNPAKNEALFCSQTLREIARLCKFGAQIFSFSSASFFQKSLQENDFEIKKIKGFKKREMVKAFYRGRGEFSDIEGYFSRPNFSENSSTNSSINSPTNSTKKIAIIGAGIAAATLAFELNLRGFKVSVFEKESELGRGASGNESGILSALILKKSSVLGEFSEFIFYEASRFYHQILGLKPSGVMEFAHTEQIKERFLEQGENPLFEINEGRAFLKDGLNLSPKSVVKSLFALSGAKLNFSHEFTHFDFKEGKFMLNFAAQKSQNDFDFLIYAMGANSDKFIVLDEMKLSKIRGQTTLIKPILNTQIPLCAKGYICPPSPKFQLIGATYDRENLDENPRENDDKINLIYLNELLKILKNEREKSPNLEQKNGENSHEFLQNSTPNLTPKTPEISCEFLQNSTLNLTPKKPEFSPNLLQEKPQILGSKVAFRSYSIDRFMICGAFYDENFYKNAYKGLMWHKKKPQITPPPHIPLFMSLAHGSRGFASAIIAARYITALICDFCNTTLNATRNEIYKKTCEKTLNEIYKEVCENTCTEPLFIPRKFIREIHPARFLIRTLKKGRI